MSGSGPTIEPATLADVASLARLRFALYEEQEGGIAESPEEYRTRFERFATRALASDDWRA